MKQLQCISSNSLVVMRLAEVVGEDYAQITELRNPLNWNVIDAVQFTGMKESTVQQEQNVVPCTYLY